MRHNIDYGYQRKNKLAFGQTGFLAAADPVEPISKNKFYQYNLVRLAKR